MSTCVSEPSAYARLHPEIQRWVREQGWAALRDLQERATNAILGGDDDVLIIAGTAAGKTEAAFLPLLTQAAARGRPGVSILYVSPLKALINDQHRRLEVLADRLELPVVMWHGDAPQSGKSRLRRDPRGIALITPESIEAMLLRRPADAERLFGDLDAVIIDELHAFLQGPRGLHLACLLRRLDELAGRRARRVGLSATIGDVGIAMQWLAPSCPQRVALVTSAHSGVGLKLQVRGLIEPPDDDGIDELADDTAADGLSRIADHLFKTLRGANHLVFAGSRRTVEALADRLRQRSETANVPEEFFPHHGSLSKELREALETRLQVGELPTTAIATTTLELGIDLGAVKSVAQIGAPRSLAGLRQRLGRSGRRGDPAILRIYVREKYPAPDADPIDRLRLETVRAVAAVRLLLDGFIEPPLTDPSLATVALHQTLSVIAQKGGARAKPLHELLCGGRTVLDVPPSVYAGLLRGAAEEGVDLIEQAPDGTLMLGRTGEKLAASREFYAVFQSDEEWRLVTAGRTLGTIPVSNVLSVGGLIGFAGRRWRVEAVDDVAKVLQVVPHPAGRLPKFDRLASEGVHDRLSAEMRSVYEGTDRPSYLDETAARLLDEGRQAFAELELGCRDHAVSGKDTHLFTWQGTMVNGLLAVVLGAGGLHCEVHDVGVTVANTSPDELEDYIATLGECPPIEDLAQFVGNLRSAKLDAFVSEDVLRSLWANRHQAARQAGTDVLASLRFALP